MASIAAYPNWTPYYPMPVQQQVGGWPMPSQYQPVKTYMPQQPVVQFHSQAVKSPEVKSDKPMIDAWQTGDENRSFLTRQCLKAITWYQQKTRYNKDGEQKSRLPFIKCPFDPSCSTYTAEAIRQHGAVKGCLLGAKRIFVHCEPLYLLYQKIFKKWDPKTQKISEPVPVGSKWTSPVTPISITA